MSSIFFDNVLPLQDPGSVRCVAWSKSEDAPILAVAEGHFVRIFREEGDELEDFKQQGRAACTTLAWHPMNNALMAGWDDGQITFGGTESHGIRDDREIHRDATICCICFNPSGSRCVTSDVNGMVAVWKTDGKGNLQQMCHYRKSGAHDKIVFRTMTYDLQPKLDNPPFFFGGEQGILYTGDDMGVASERNKFGSPLQMLEYFHQKDVVVVITKSVILAQFSLDAEGKVVRETKLKLSCGPHPEKLQGVWAGMGLLATSSHESIVRLWNIADDESYIMSLQGVDERNSVAGDKILCVDFNPRKRVLACGTRSGRIVQWRCSTLGATPKSENCWQKLPVINGSDRGIDRITWGPGESLLHVKTDRSNVILSEASLNTTVQPPYLAVQTAPTQVLLYHLDQQSKSVVSPGYRIRGISIGGSNIMLYNSKQVTVHSMEGHGLGVSLSHQFKHETSPIASACLIVQGMEKQIAIATGSKIEFCNMQGGVKNSITFSENEGNPICLDINGPFLVACTSQSVLKVWKVSGNKEKLIATRKFEDIEEVPLGEIRSVRINCDGSRVSLLVDQRLAPGGAHGGASTLRVPDPRIFVYDLESDSFLRYLIGKSRVPVAHTWDCGDPRLVACEVVSQALAYNTEGPPDSPKSMPPTPANVGGGLLDKAQDVEEDSEPSHCVMTLFVVGAEKILPQDSITCSDPERGGAPRMPVAIVAPHVYFTRQLGDLSNTAGLNESQGADQDASAIITRVPLRDFVGLEHCDAETTSALLNFSFHLANGKIDAAYEAIKGVGSQGVWESLSKMCVKTGKLDVAQKCLGQMGHARAAGALRACTEPETDARLAIVAVHLDMIEDAEHLLKKCGRWDLLNNLYQACGEWEKALEVAKTKDRVHLKPTHFAYAQHLEAIEDVTQALSHFELSGTYRTESPRLLCALGMTDDLAAYVEGSDDAHLHRWYAQYLESKSDLDGASREYRKAGDWLSLCRVACFNKDLDGAQRICEDSQDTASCYHLARHLEADGRTKEAIHFFQLAGRVSHALRLAQDNNYEGDLMSLALSSDPTNMASAAKYYENRGQPSKAVILYQKAGFQKRALELCFSARLFDALRKIADDLNADSDPEILGKCGEFFMQHNQNDKAVHLLSMSNQHERAVDLCVEHDVQINEDMAERMTPDKGSMEANQRSEILQKMARLCKKQGSFQLACKKFTQAGDKLKAMKSLLQSGDTEKIIFFAGTARQAEIYVLAGNYLQSLDWNNDPEIMKNIIQFYSKAKAYDKLASFYDACAQVEIDEYRDYDKAGGALRESLKFLAKSVGAGAENDQRVQSLQHRISLVDKFAGIRKTAKENPNEMVSVCEEMVDMRDIESAVRIGDIFAQLVEHYAEVRNFTEAHRSIERMREKKIQLMPYVDQALLETIYNAVGQPVPRQEGAAAPAAVAAEPDVDEEIEEDDDN